MPINSKGITAIVCCLFFVALVACGKNYSDDVPEGEDTDATGQTDTDADTDAAGDSDSQTGADTSATSDTEQGTDTDTEGQIETDIDTGADNSCGSEDFEIELMPLDMLLALDTSYSMDFAVGNDAITKWQAVAGAVKDFVADDLFSGIGLGIQYFPLRRLCTPTAYEVPAVPIAALPGASGDIAHSLDSQRMASGTPMAPLLQGVLAYTKTWAEAHPDRRTVLVLATDGIPDHTCKSSSDGAIPNTLENVIALAEEAAEGTTRVTTYVIGVGTELTSLNAISQAGNGRDAFLVDVDDEDVHKAFLEALESIRRRTACDYDISLFAQQKAIDYNRANIGFSIGVNDEMFSNVGKVDRCYKAPKSGWFYDNPEAPEKIILCEETCEKVQSSVGGKLHIAFGCKTIVV